MSSEHPLDQGIKDKIALFLAMWKVNMYCKSGCGIFIMKHACYGKRAFSAGLPVMSEFDAPEPDLAELENPMVDSLRHPTVKSLLH